MGNENLRRNQQKSNADHLTVNSYEDKSLLTNLTNRIRKTWRDCWNCTEKCDQNSAKRYIAVIVFSGLVIVSLVEILKCREPDARKLLAALLGISHFGLCATAILHLKYCGVMEMNPLKCKIWIYLEVYNIAATTAFIVLATRHLLPAPFHQWTGTALLLIIYWLPLIMYKTSQVCRMLEFVSVLNYLQDSSVQSIRKHCYNNAVRSVPCASHAAVSSTASKNSHVPLPFTTITTASSSPLQVASVIPPILPLSKSVSASSPHIPYEWALIDSISNALP